MRTFRDVCKNYYFTNKNLRFFSQPKEFYGFTADEVAAILDILTIYIDNEAANRRIPNYEIPILRPFNLIMGKYKEDLLLAFINDNAIYGLTLIGTLKDDINPSIEAIWGYLDVQSKYLLGCGIDLLIGLDFNMLIEKRLEFNDYLESIKTSVFSSLTLSQEVSEIFKQAAIDYIDILIREKNLVNIEPIFKTRNVTVDEKLCFTLLPFINEQMEIFDQIISPTLKKEFDIQTLRANDIFGINPIMEDIWTYILKAKFLIADITGKNTNVYYELGICHTVGKDVIVICEENSYHTDYNGKFPFDIAHRRIIPYKNTGPGMLKFQADLTGTVKSLYEKPELN